MLTEVEELHRRTYLTINTVHRAVRSEPIPKEDLVDAALLLKETMATLKDLSGEANALFEAAQKVACVRWVQDSVNEEAASSIKGKFAVGTPDVKLMAPIPKRDTNEHRALCDFFGVPHDAPVKFHWPAMTEVVSERLAEGRPLPPGMKDSRYTLYRLSPLRRSKQCQGKEETTSRRSQEELPW